MSASLTLTSSLLRTSLREWRWPVEQWTTRNLDLALRTDVRPWRVAWVRMCSRREVAEKPGEARRMTLRLSRSKFRNMD